MTDDTDAPQAEEVSIPSSVDADGDIERSHHTEDYSENDGRSVHIDTGFYEVQVWGDPGDDFEAVMDKAHEAADRAKADRKELDDNQDNGDDTHYR